MKHVCPECGEEGEKENFFDLDNIDEKNPVHMLAKHLDISIKIYADIAEKSGRAIVSGDHHTGIAIVMFRGTREEAEKVKNYIKNEL